MSQQSTGSNKPAYLLVAAAIIMLLFILVGIPTFESFSPPIAKKLGFPFDQKIFDGKFYTYTASTIVGLFSGAISSLFMMGILRGIGHENILKPEIKEIYKKLTNIEDMYVNNTDCSALKENCFSNEIRCAYDLIEIKKEAEPIPAEKYQSRLDDERKTLNNSVHILTLSYDLLDGYYSGKGSGDGPTRLLKQQNLHTGKARRIVIVEPEIYSHRKLKDFLDKFSDNNWRIISRNALGDSGKREMFRDFAVFCSDRHEPEAAYFTFMNVSMENLFTKASWAAYRTVNKDYVIRLFNKFEALWKEDYVQRSTTELWNEHYA